MRLLQERVTILGLHHLNIAFQPFTTNSLVLLVGRSVTSYTRTLGVVMLRFVGMLLSDVT